MKKLQITIAAISAVLLLGEVRLAEAACSGGATQFTCLSEADYLAKLGELGYSTIVEGFEDDAAWGTVRSMLTVTNSAPSITSQGITWTANHVQSEITTGMARRTGRWGLYDPDHGYATGSTAQCDIDNPPEHCLWYDGFTGTRAAGEAALYAAGGYIKTSTVGAALVLVIDDDEINRIDFGKLSDTAYHFFGVIDTRGFNRFQFKEIDGKIGQKFLIFGDDFTFAIDPAGANSAPVWLPDTSAAVNHSWSFIDAASGYLDAVVIAGPPTTHGGDPGVLRLRNVSDLGFEMRFQEWDYRARDFGDTSHAVEDIPYVVLQPGRHLMSDGSEWEVGRFNLGGTGNWQGILFDTPFAAPPHLFLTVQTYNGSQAVAVRARNVSMDGFEAALLEEEALMDGHSAESIGYLAIDSPAGGGLLDLDAAQVPYLLQSLSADHRWSPVLSQRLRVEEEQSRDSEVRHVDETLHVLALGDQVLAQQVSHNGADTSALRRLAPTQDAPMEWGLIRGIDHHWQTLPFAKTYTDPVLIAKPASNNGADPGVIRLRNITTTDAELRYQEWNYLDGSHPTEDVFYMISEAGEYSLAGLSVEADWLTSNKLGRAGQWDAIGFNSLFLADPAVFASVMSYNGADTVTTRIRNLDLSGFELAMDEQESKTDGHTNERLGWIAIEQGSATTSDGRRLQVFFEQLNHVLTPVPYPTASAHRHPSVLVDIDSNYGGDTVSVRHANPTNAQIELKLSEEQSRDAETNHVLEDVGVFVGE